MNIRRIAVVTGGNRGIGLAVCHQLASLGLKVILTSRVKEQAIQAQVDLLQSGLEVDAHELDVTSQASIDEALDFMQSKYPRIDVLVNNAGVMLDIANDGMQTRVATAFESSLDSIRQSFETNTLGPFELIRRVVPTMLKNGYGRIVNVSSGLGQISTAGALWPGYRISKISLNALTKIFAAELANTNILINAASPGWVKTRMGGEQATLSPAQGAETITWLATLPDSGPSGGFFENKQPIAW